TRPPPAHPRPPAGARFPILRPCDAFGRGGESTKCSRLHGTSPSYKKGLPLLFEIAIFRDATIPEMNDGAMSTTPRTGPAENRTDALPRSANHTIAALIIRAIAAILDATMVTLTIRTPTLD